MSLRGFWVLTYLPDPSAWNSSEAARGPMLLLANLVSAERHFPQVSGLQRVCCCSWVLFPTPVLHRSLNYTALTFDLVYISTVETGC